MGRIVFTGFMGLVLLGALVTAWSWPVRASIIVLTLGALGITLTALQLTLDVRGSLAKTSQDGPLFDTPPAETASCRGNVEVWGWIIGFYLTIHVIGFPAAVPIFVLAYTKVYGAGWLTALGLAVFSWGFLYGIFERILHVPWPKPFFGFLM